MTHVPAAPDPTPLVEPKLYIKGVIDPGSPNFERVLLYTTGGGMNLTGFGITVAVLRGGFYYPLYDNCFWFPDVSVEDAAVIQVYSREGTTEWGAHNEVQLLHLFWQRASTVFDADAKDLVPMLFHIDATAGGEVL